MKRWAGLALALHCLPGMDSGSYAALTGLLAGTQALDLTANNLANISTNGFKAQRGFYQALEATLGDPGKRALSPLNEAINNYGVLGGARVDVQTGSLEQTGNDLDLAMEGPGFFVVKTSRGLRYTRNGNFRADPGGRLLTATGDEVMGEKGPLKIPHGPVAVSPDGKILAKGGVAGRLKIVDLTPDAELIPEGNSTYAISKGSASPAVRPEVCQGMLETSNLNPIMGTVDLILIQRQTQILQQAISIFNNDFDKSAVEELAHVS